MERWVQRTAGCASPWDLSNHVVNFAWTIINVKVCWGTEYVNLNTIRRSASARATMTFPGCGWSTCRSRSWAGRSSRQVKHSNLKKPSKYSQNFLQNVTGCLPPCEYDSFDMLHRNIENPLLLAGVGDDASGIGMTLRSSNSWEVWRENDYRD